MSEGDPAAVANERFGQPAPAKTSAWDEQHDVRDAEPTPVHGESAATDPL
jgi:hypothetical protein